MRLLLWRMSVAICLPLPFAPRRLVWRVLRSWCSAPTVRTPSCPRRSPQGLSCGLRRLPSSLDFFGSWADPSSSPSPFVASETVETLTTLVRGGRRLFAESDVRQERCELIVDLREAAEESWRQAVTFYAPARALRTSSGSSWDYEHPHTFTDTYCQFMRAMGRHPSGESHRCRLARDRSSEPDAASLAVRVASSAAASAPIVSGGSGRPVEGGSLSHRVIRATEGVFGYSFHSVFDVDALFADEQLSFYAVDVNGDRVDDEWSSSACVRSDVWL